MRIRRACGSVRSSGADSVSPSPRRSEEHTSELQSPCNIVCRLLLEKKNVSPSLRMVSSPRFVNAHQGARAVRLDAGQWACSRIDYEPCRLRRVEILGFFFFNDTATTEIYPLSLHDALPI